MGSSLLKIYHSLPPFARHAIASARGYSLHHWRYDERTDGLAKEARIRETWSPTQWREWQQPQLRSILEQAARKVPYYRMSQQGRHRSSVPQTDSILSDWPILSKEALRRSPKDFLVEGTALGELRVENTSGTTGTPLRLWQSQEMAKAWYALMEARWRGWYGVSRSDRWAILGGQLVTPVRQKSPPFWVWNAGLKQLYLSSNHLSAETCAAYAKALQDYRVTYLWGYASALHALALFLAEIGAARPKLSVVISNAEPLFAHQRELMAQVFACPVRDTYGLSEKVCAASECEAGKLHLWPEVGIYEVLRDDEDKPVKDGEIGRLVCTGLLNRDMPLIRYEVGDRVAIAPASEKCACGRTLPILLSVEGRSDDVILTPDGRRIGRLDPVFKGSLPIREAQIIQESLALIRVLVVPAREFTDLHERDLATAVRERVGNVEVQIERVREIPRSANGKFRGVISKIGRGTAGPKQSIDNDVLIPG